MVNVAGMSPGGGDYFSFFGINGDDVAHVQAGDIGDDGQSAGVLDGVEKDGGDGPGDDDPGPAFIGNGGNILADMP
jgi:hypothetical protein